MAYGIEARSVRIISAENIERYSWYIRSLSYLSTVNFASAVCNLFVGYGCACDWNLFLNSWVPGSTQICMSWFHSLFFLSLNVLILFFLFYWGSSLDMLFCYLENHEIKVTFSAMILPFWICVLGGLAYKYWIWWVKNYRLWLGIRKHHGKKENPHQMELGSLHFFPKGLLGMFGAIYVWGYNYVL